MDGDGIYDWIEKLMPMFNGNYSLAEITDGLPLPYQNRVFEIERFYMKMVSCVMQIKMHLMN